MSEHARSEHAAQLRDSRGYARHIWSGFDANTDEPVTENYYAAAPAKRMAKRHADTYGVPVKLKRDGKTWEIIR